MVYVIYLTIRIQYYRMRKSGQASNPKPQNKAENNDVNIGIMVANKWILIIKQNIDTSKNEIYGFIPLLKGKDT